MANFNTARLAEDIKREISTAMRDIKDGAVVKAMVGVSRCELTSDLSYCKVYITTLEGGDTTKMSPSISRRQRVSLKEESTSV